MFGRKTRTTLSDQVATIIGENSVVKGSINSSSSLRIDGEIEGEVTTAADLIVGESAMIKAAVVAKNAVVAGTVTAKMTIGDNLELLPTAKVVGAIQAGSLVIAKGAVFKGICEMKFEAE